MFLWWWLKRSMSDKPRSRKLAVQRLATFADYRAYAAIERGLTDSDSAVRRAAAEVFCHYDFQQLGKNHAQTAMHFIMLPLARAVKDRAICNLAEQAISRIAEMLVDKQYHDSYSSEIGLRPFHTFVIDDLQRALSERDTEVRRAAVRAYGHCANKWGHGPTLFDFDRLIRDPDMQVRQGVAIALRKVVERDGVIFVTALAERLAVLLNDTEVNVRRAAVKVLGPAASYRRSLDSVVPKEFVDLLKRATHDQDMEVRQSSFEALQHLGIRRRK